MRNGKNISASVANYFKILLRWVNYSFLYRRIVTNNFSTITITYQDQHYYLPLVTDTIVLPM
jgi:hypothetical protein